MATRLEDVAAAVGLKRAALFYHFADKQRLYDAVIADAFGELASRLEQAFTAPGPIAARVERGVEVWVETITARPALARLILRHAAEAEDHDSAGIFDGADKLLRMAWNLLEQGRASGELQPVHEDLFHAASAVLGATVFYVAGFAALLPGQGFTPLAQEQVDAHKRNTLQTVRLLLGIRAPQRRKKAPLRAAKARAKK